MGKLSDYILPRKRDFKYELAMESTKAITSLFKLYREGDLDVNIDTHAFVKIHPNDESSPALYWLAKDQYIIRYPEHSTPYNHKFFDKCKFIECLSGKIYDKNSNTKLFKGDQLKVTPKDNFVPYTLDEVCFLRVVIGDCDSTLNQILK
jgi:hypothetical protein